MHTREEEGVREIIPHIGPIPVLIPLKLFLVTKFKVRNVISFDWVNRFHYFFFSFEIFVTRSFRNRHNISHNTKSNFVTLFYRRKKSSLDAY